MGKANVFPFAGDNFWRKSFGWTRGPLLLTLWRRTRRCSLRRSMLLSWPGLGSVVRRWAVRLVVIIWDAVRVLWSLKYTQKLNTGEMAKSDKLERTWQNPNINLQWNPIESIIHVSQLPFGFSQGYSLLSYADDAESELQSISENFSAADPEEKTSRDCSKPLPEPWDWERNLLASAHLFGAFKVQ